MYPVAKNKICICQYSIGNNLNLCLVHLSKIQNNIIQQVLEGEKDLKKSHAKDKLQLSKGIFCTLYTWHM